MTNRPSPLEVEAVPFPRILVPYDGSAQAQTALVYGIALAQRGASLDILHVVDVSSVLTETSTSVVGFDPMPLIESLEAQGRALAEAARERCRRSGVEPHITVVRDLPVVGIGKVAEANGDALIVLGTHGRSGLTRTFLGSTTEGVLRSSSIPVLAVHADMAPPDRLFSKILVAVDDSEPAEAGVALAARIVRSAGASAVVCSVSNVNDILQHAGMYGYDPTPLLADLLASTKDAVDRAIAHGGFPAGTATPSIAEDEPSRGIIAEAVRVGADLIIMGSHGRRGLRRLFLGSVAEHVVRHSSIPIVVVRSAARARFTQSSPDLHARV